MTTPHVSRATSTHTRLVLAGALLSIGCDRERDGFRDCSDVDVSATDSLPERLSGTGLYSDIGARVLADDIVEFTPRFPLWTDGASKRRFLLLPEGGQVDTTDPDDWDFPVGTRFFKEFERDGVVVETRMNVRLDTEWAAATYLWTDAGDDAERLLLGVNNASGTPHDVPGAAECQACHGGRRNFTLGFSETQLDLGTRIDLYEQGWFTTPAESELDLATVEAEGLGVLHANCSHCHNKGRSHQAQATDCYDPGAYNDFDLTLPAGLDRATDAPAVSTARDLLGSGRDSKVLDRMSRRDKDAERPSMPPLGTEVVDEAGVAAVRAFIEAL